MNKRNTIVRATKCSFKYATNFKRDTLKHVLIEYAAVVNQFIAKFWTGGIPAKKDLNASVYSQAVSWLSPTMKQIAAREAVDMVKASRERDGDKAIIPVHKAKKMQLTAQVVQMGVSETEEFDHWLNLSAIAADKSIKFSVPIKRHKHWNILEKRGFHRMNSYVITPDGIQFAFQKEIEKAPKEGRAIGLDTGINALASLSDGTQFGTELQALIKKSKRCKWGSEGHKTAQRHIKQYICETAKKIFREKDFGVLVVELLKNMNYETKRTHRLRKKTRCSIGIWNWRLWLEKLEMLAEESCTRIWKVLPHHTSQKCRQCGFASRGNRHNEKFRCQKCGYADNADLNASENILDRLTMGPYGAHYQGIYRNGDSNVSASFKEIWFQKAIT